MKSWKCDICGYVHKGDEPPASCVLCNADRDHFSLLDIKPTRPPAKADRWRCSICDYIHSGDQPPERCPVCGAGSSIFSPVTEQLNFSGRAEVGKILILGAGIAGLTAAEEARKSLPDADIKLINKEPGTPYYRLNLTRLLAGEISSEDLPMQSASWFAEQKIELIAGEALQIDRQRKKVLLRDGRSFAYDRLVLANGTHPFVPPIPGVTRDGVCTLRTLEDARKILQRLPSVNHCVCIGGGLLGLETAAALAKHGVKVTVLEGHGWLMPRQLPQAAAMRLEQHLKQMGIDVVCSAAIKELAGDESLRAVLLQDGREITAELAVISAGVRPNSCLPRQAELKVKHGLLVDDRMATSDPDIFAAGDIAEHNGLLYGIWPASYAQGAVAGINASGGDAEFSSFSMSTRIKVVDVDLFSVGQLALNDASYRLLEKADEKNYCGIVYRDNHLVGAVLFGDTSAAGVLKDAVEKGTQLPELPLLQQLFPELGG